MDQVITLGKTDNILQVRSQVEWSDGRRIILVVPRGCRALDAEHELQLLRRWADEADVQVALVSTAYNLNEMAAVAGLPVFSSVEKATGSTWHWQRGPAQGPVRRSSPLDDDLPGPRKPLLDRLGLAGWKLLVTLVLFGLATVGLLYVASLLVPSASISIHPASVVVSDTSEVILDPTVTTIDQINAIIPAGNVRKEMSGTVTVRTSKSATAPADHAAGTVIFSNLQGTEATIPVGTVVATTSGVTQRYSTTVTATLPAGFNARVNVPVRALKPGPDGNVRPLQINFIEGPLSAVARVVNTEAVGGGSIKQVNIVSFDDRQTARDQMNADLRHKAPSVLQSAADEENAYIVPISIQVIVLGETFDHLVDDPSDTLSLKTDAVAAGLSASYDNLETFAQRRLLSKVPPGYTVLPGTMRVEGDPNARAEGNSVILRVRSALLTTPVVDRDKLLDGLENLPVDEAARLIGERVKLAEPPTIHITPSWWGRMPSFGFRTVLFVATTQ